MYIYTHTIIYVCKVHNIAVGHDIKHCLHAYYVYTRKHNVWSRLPILCTSFPISVWTGGHGRRVIAKRNMIQLYWSLIVEMVVVDR